MNNRLKKIFFLPFLLPLCWIGTTVDMVQHADKTQKCSQKLNQCLIETDKEKNKATQQVSDESHALAESALFSSYESDSGHVSSSFLIELFSVLFSLATFFIHKPEISDTKKHYRLSLIRHTHYFRCLRLNANRLGLYLATLHKLFHSRLQFIFSPQAFI